MTDLAALDADAALLAILGTDEGRADPYPHYARLRKVAPVHHSMVGAWVVSTFEASQVVLRDPRFGKDFTAQAQRFGLSESDMEQLLAFRRERRTMLFADPPDHTRLRGIASKAFTPRTVEALRPHVERLTHDVLDDLADAADPADFMATVAFPLPVTVIGELLGVPTDDRPPFQGLVRRAAIALELNMTPEQMVDAQAATMEMEAYFSDLIAERRRAPGDDLLSALIGAEDDGQRLTEMEVISTAILLFGAGFETTTNLLGNGLLALLEHPDQLARLRRDPSLVRPAIEEILRYDSPVQMNGRIALEAVEVGGRLVEAGAAVLTIIGSANRDEARFVEPDRFDIGRDEGPSMSFGSGIHYCIGAALARMEGQVVLGALLDRFGRIELATGTPPYRNSLTLRGLAELPLHLEPA